MATYADLLQDPRWQKKKSETLNRDEFTCQACGSKTQSLHVHHRYYDKDAEGPWDYPDESLVTLCLSCHNQVGEFMKVLRKHVGMSLSLDNFVRSFSLGVFKPQAVAQVMSEILQAAAIAYEETGSSQT